MSDFANEGATATLPVLLRHARDVHAYATLHPLAPAAATLNGVVTRRDKRKARTFLTLRDTTGTVQVVLEQERLGRDGFEASKAAVKLSWVTVTGTIGRTDSGELSLFADAAPTVRAGELDASIREGELAYARVGAQILASRLRERAERFFRAKGFMGIEPALISASWGGSGLEPLRVRYEGFGDDAFLAPSPASQLEEALFATGLSRVYAVSRCFTTTYRDERSSAESVVLVAKATDVPADEAVDIVRHAVVDTLGATETLPEDLSPLTKAWRTITPPWPPSGSVKRTSPTFERFESPVAVSDRSVSEVFRLVWPEHRVIAEGATQLLDEVLSVTTVTIHLERLVSLLRDIPVRQLRHLDRRAPPGAVIAESS